MGKYGYKFSFEVSVLGYKRYSWVFWWYYVSGRSIIVRLSVQSQLLPVLCPWSPHFPSFNFMRRCAYCLDPFLYPICVPVMIVLVRHLFLAEIPLRWSGRFNWIREIRLQRSFRRFQTIRLHISILIGREGGTLFALRRSFLFPLRWQGILRFVLSIPFGLYTVINYAVLSNPCAENTDYRLDDWKINLYS